MHSKNVLSCKNLIYCSILGFPKLNIWYAAVAGAWKLFVTDDYPIIFLLQYNNHEIRSGKHIGVCISVANNRLFVGSIPKSKTKEQIVEEFSKVTGESVTTFYRGGKCQMWSVMSCLLAYSWVMMKTNSAFISTLCVGVCWVFLKTVVLLRAEIFVIGLDGWVKVLPVKCVMFKTSVQRNLN